MKALSLFTSIILFFIAFISPLLGAACPNIVVRKEIRDLTPTELTTFLDAVKQLNLRPEPTSPSAYDSMVKRHVDNMNLIHGVPEFFPWHRNFVLEFEKMLQQISPNITVPYWDWTIDSQSPERSLVFTSAYFGGNGQGSSKCVSDGPFAFWNGYYKPAGLPTCLSRNFDGGNVMGAFVAPEVLAMFIKQATTYDGFRITIEGTPHGSVHMNIGGDMSTMHSPNDPIFWIHHSFVDKIWNEYQNMGNGSNTYRYDAQDGSQMDVNALLAGWNVTIHDVMNTTDLCYRYQEPSYSSSTSNTSTTTIAVKTTTAATTLPTTIALSSTSTLPTSIGTTQTQASTSTSTSTPAPTSVTVALSSTTTTTIFTTTPASTVVSQITPAITTVHASSIQISTTLPPISTTSSSSSTTSASIVTTTSSSTTLVEATSEISTPAPATTSSVPTIVINIQPLTTEIITTSLQESSVTTTDIPSISISQAMPTTTTTTTTAATTTTTTATTTTTTTSLINPSTTISIISTTSISEAITTVIVPISATTTSSQVTITAAADGPPSTTLPSSSETSSIPIITATTTTSNANALTTSSIVNATTVVSTSATSSLNSMTTTITESNSIASMTCSWSAPTISPIYANMTEASYLNNTIFEIISDMYKSQSKLTNVTGAANSTSFSGHGSTVDKQVLCAYDRANRSKIRVPVPLAPFFLSQFHMDEASVRIVEFALLQVYTALNGQEDFQSAAAIASVEEMLMENWSSKLKEIYNYTMYTQYQINVGQ